MASPTHSNRSIVDSVQSSISSDRETGPNAFVLCFEVGWGESVGIGMWMLERYVFVHLTEWSRAPGRFRESVGLVGAW